MTSHFDDEDLSLSISTTTTRRSTNRPSDASSRGRDGTPTGRPTPQNPPRPEAMQRTSMRLGQYHIVKTLGEGSFGKVKLAVHQVSGQKVALKIINRRKLVTRDMAGRIEREIQYLQLLRHPHIIKL
jgi:carbon catabolite-derepressing protein kinase